MPELVFGHLLTSDNYDDSERRSAGSGSERLTGYTGVQGLQCSFRLPLGPQWLVVQAQKDFPSKPCRNVRVTMTI